MKREPLRDGLKNQNEVHRQPVPPIKPHRKRGVEQAVTCRKIIARFSYDDGSMCNK